MCDWIEKCKFDGTDYPSDEVIDKLLARLGDFCKRCAGTPTSAVPKTAVEQYRADVLQFIEELERPLPSQLLVKHFLPVRYQEFCQIYDRMGPFDFRKYVRGVKDVFVGRVVSKTRLLKLKVQVNIAIAGVREKTTVTLWLDRTFGPTHEICPKREYLFLVPPEGCMGGSHSILPHIANGKPAALVHLDRRNDEYFRGFDIVRIARSARFFDYHISIQSIARFVASRSPEERLTDP